METTATLLRATAAEGAVLDNIDRSKRSRLVIEVMFHFLKSGNRR
jgi:hypothetical protein